MNRGYTSPVTEISEKDFETLVQMALDEDLPAGDITTDTLFAKEETCTAVLLAKEEGILCGTAVIPCLIQKTKADVTWNGILSDGATLSKGTVVGELKGSLVGILKMERILLNFIQYLSGIATNANKVAKQFPNLLILDTRKTLPGYRKLAKYAVYMGGGANHRLNLSEMAMLKDNHIARAGSIQTAVQLVREKNPGKKIELEIDGIFQLNDAILAKPDIILLDNFSDTDTEKAIQILKETAPMIRIECSGGITPEKLNFLSKFDGIGVSMGYLTHTVKFLDISLDIK
ncbi:carboxylating nicotinate-nucleotide diphosphorylase [Leptospira biflexa]|uniref:Probable nicotinate-nucleotide pyrophosphorylase [carboxylating] n=1 Tax=Leptospira biflexa serovar Patoc (strain Patoc 1 / ATCC 23582 / Paris) TaxID=456481 RepID=B0STH9_LEPBP|nr:carboxylating nicotinate-nucleotide diphosphorylase [Leptospira biflexa]ABZ94752.1 Nicotinate-nucleotide pyrophosphorylase [Leptospira biflexa serovar Patoc strain 'Patoc 1 (Ames)']ABZ98419.1 Nicotinate-nucleotide pyrophosphorylase [carboxylating] (Quinolinate phosphoribosyltransferase [decarboxylating]) QAPRTase [Leptospira biflexa serovar Patoc strain 'Patoc 1 (Paris)']TGM44077.1 carboxylating nicotinate-nucleotide diphosphorylase [Leptospira biflexa]TGM45055.1 carboxylating nicotinate-nuc